MQDSPLLFSAGCRQVYLSEEGQVSFCSKSCVLGPEEQRDCKDFESDKIKDESVMIGGQ